MKICIMKKTLSDYTGSVTIEKGKLIIVESDRIKTIDGKKVIVQREHKTIPEYICGVEYGTVTKGLKYCYSSCNFTCQEGEILIMTLSTDFHSYYAIGQNPYEMYKKIIKMYNGYSGQKFTDKDFHKGIYDYGIKISDEYPLNIYKCSADLIYFDDESYGFRNKYDKENYFCGNYWDLYKSDDTRVFPNTTMI